MGLQTIKEEEKHNIKSKVQQRGIEQQTGAWLHPSGYGSGWTK